MILLAWMGWSRRRRLMGLARTANEMGMRFSPDDPFGLTKHYSGFVLASAGHSGRAENVVFGRYDGRDPQTRNNASGVPWMLRAFDYCFEVGHGTRRLSRRYGVIAADTDLDLPDLLMWSSEDSEHVPLAAGRPLGRSGQWMVITGMEFARTMTEAFSNYSDRPIDLQIDNGSVMICSPVRWKPAELAAELARAVECLQRLRKESPRLTE
ncbi:MAG: hypothetical protein SVV80_02420 [Planctomycetota bacterium]|nr:hypothetical protein [Planctomycetota bacterium]